MTYKICYWDIDSQAQGERDATQQEAAEIESRKNSAPIVIVPNVVTKRQGRQALILDGKIAFVQPAIDAISDQTQRALMQSEYDDSQEYHRDRPSLIMLANAIGYTTPEQIDNLFIFASTL